MKRSKVYIYSASPESILILEAPTSYAGRVAYSYIKEHLPAVSLGIIGARDVQTLYRAHRELKPSHIVKDVNKFIQLAYEEQKPVFN